MTSTLAQFKLLYDWWWWSIWASTQNSVNTEIYFQSSHLKYIKRKITWTKTCFRTATILVIKIALLNNYHQHHHHYTTTTTSASPWQHNLITSSKISINNQQIQHNHSQAKSFLKTQETHIHIFEPVPKHSQKSPGNVYITRNYHE